MVLKEIVLIRKPHESLGIVSLFNELELLVNHPPTRSLRRERPQDTRVDHSYIPNVDRVTLTKVFHSQWPPSPTHMPGCCSLFHFMAQLLLLLQGPFLGMVHKTTSRLKWSLNEITSLACCRSSIEQYCWRKLSSFQSYGLLQTRYQEIRGIGAHALWHGNKLTRISEMAVTALWHHVELLTYTAGYYIYKFTYSSGIVIIYSGIFSESMASWNCTQDSVQVNYMYDMCPW
jgi:hypothetical protein